MTINEAIVILVKMSEITLNYYSPSRKAALDLGIEALKLIKHTRQNTQKPAFKRLPGETD